MKGPTFIKLRNSFILEGSWRSIPREVRGLPTNTEQVGHGSRLVPSTARGRTSLEMTAGEYCSGQGDLSHLQDSEREGGGGGVSVWGS